MSSEGAPELLKSTCHLLKAHRDAWYVQVTNYVEKPVCDLWNQQTLQRECHRIDPCYSLQDISDHYFPLLIQILIKPLCLAAYKTDPKPANKLKTNHIDSPPLLFFTNFWETVNFINFSDDSVKGGRNLSVIVHMLYKWRQRMKSKDELTNDYLHPAWYMSHRSLVRKRSERMDYEGINYVSSILI
jgi:hypothetical protein